MVLPKIVVIGAGSASCGLNTLATLMNSRRLHGSRLALVDVNTETPVLVGRLASQLNHEWGAQMVIATHPRHQEALDGADFVIAVLAAGPQHHRPGCGSARPR